MGAKFDASNVPEPYGRAVGIEAHHDVAEFFGRDQSPLRAHGVGKLLPLRRRLPTNLARRVHCVLLLDGILQVSHRQAELGDLIGLDPDPHRVVGRAPGLHVPDARNPLEGVVNIDRRVIAQEVAIVGAVR